MSDIGVVRILIYCSYFEIFEIKNLKNLKNLFIKSTSNGISEFTYLTNTFEIKNFVKIEVLESTSDF